MSEPVEPGTGDLSVSAPGPWEHRRVTANGVSIHFAQMGPERTDHALILIHGFPLYWWQWHEVMPLLAERGYRVIAMDLRGYGESDMQADESDLADLARDVSGVAGALGLRSFTAVGVGMGGTVAWMLGAMGAVRLRSIVLASAPHPLERHFVPQQFTKASVLNGLMTIPLHRVRALENEKYLSRRIGALAAAPNRARLLRDVPRYHAALIRPFAAEKAADTWSATRFPSHDSRKSLENRVTVPVVSVRGSEDPLFAPGEFSRDAEHCTAGLEQHVIPGSGFFVPREAPAELAAIIAAHVDSLQPLDD